MNLFSMYQPVLAAELLVQNEPRGLPCFDLSVP